MLKSQNYQDESSVFALDRFVEANKMLVEHYRNFKSEELGITRPLNILEVLEDGARTDPVKMTKCAIICENFMRQTMSLQETSRADLPKWVKTGLALISASQADDLTDKVISEQPLQSRTGKVHYLDIQTERSKGDLAGGFRMFDALRGYAGTENFSSEKVVNEPIGASGSADYTVTAEYLPIIPGSFELTDGTQVIHDDRNGNLVGDIAVPVPPITNTVNYITGEISVSFAAATTDKVVANYSYNIEAATELPKYGISLRSITIEARPRAIATEWSQQSVFDLLNDWGIDAEPTILDAGAKIIMSEKFKHVVNHLYRVASGGALVWDNTTPIGVTYQEHIESFGILLTRLQNEIWQRTQRVRPNVCVFSPDIWFLFQHQKGFEGQGAPGQSDALAGPKLAGILKGHNMTCICDPTFPEKSGMVTYRGGELVNTAAIVGMYIPLYKAPVHVKGFHKDTALLSEYAIHVVNSDMLGTLSVINL